VATKTTVCTLLEASTAVLAILAKWGIPAALEQLTVEATVEAVAADHLHTHFKSFNLMLTLEHEVALETCINHKNEA
jgi:hypothetical protein